MEIYPDINPLRSLVFVRHFGNRIIANTDIKVRKDAGNLAQTGLDSELSPPKIRFNAAKSLIKLQETKNAQDRLIDFFA